jgi:catechol 2,3-dioxygenase-like lactoylglutathione lyase family enzyme
MIAAVMRVARACADLDAMVRQYSHGLSFEVLSQWCDHDGFDGATLGHPHAPWHLEFIHAHAEPKPPTPHAEQALVFYVPDRAEWTARCASMQAAGFAAVEPDNPYWARHARSFADIEGGRVILSRQAWER